MLAAPVYQVSPLMGSNLIIIVFAVVVVGGAGMKDIVKRIMDKDPQLPVNVTYPPALISSAIEMTALHFMSDAPMAGRYIIGSQLITPENAERYYFPDSPF